MNNATISDETLVEQQTGIPSFFEKQSEEEMLDQFFEEIPAPSEMLLDTKKPIAVQAGNAAAHAVSSLVKKDVSIVSKPKGFFRQILHTLKGNRASQTPAILNTPVNTSHIFKSSIQLHHKDTEVSYKRIVLEVQSLHKHFGKKHAVRGVSFKMYTGEIVGFLGPNGAGKTTVFYMIVGFQKPDHGAILYDGQDISKLPMFKRAKLGISYLPQEASIFRRLTVEQNIMAVLETARGMHKKDMKERTDKLIYEFGLEGVRKQKAYTLSGGERRRTEIARGMALKPHFLLLDEPFTGIDPKARYELKQIIESLAKRNIGVLITDHNERDTLSITNRAFIVHDGHIVVTGSYEEIMQNVKAREIYLGEHYT